MIRKIGIAGTAKNTGKTTAAMALISRWPDAGSLAVTSIGYDGEEVDNVTNLPKPRLHLHAGSLVVTAERCLQAGSARLEKLEQLPLQTPLGRLFVCRVRSSGLVVLAGPNSEKALELATKRLEDYRVSALLIDGALNRLAPMRLADGLIIATGAARTTNLELLAQEAEAIDFLLNLPVLTADEAFLTVNNLLVEANLRQYPLDSCAFTGIRLTGLIDIKPFLSLTERFRRCPSQPTLIFVNPVSLLLCGDLLKMAGLLKQHVKNGGQAGLSRSLPLLAVTVNPFYPKYHEANREYVGAWVDKQELRAIMAARLKTAVVDVMSEGGDRLYSLVMDFFVRDN